MVTDGQRLFVGGRKGLFAFDLASHAWSEMKTDIGSVVALARQEGILWAGSETTGLWRCDLTSDGWTQAASPEALGGEHIFSLAVGGGKVYVGAGSEQSGRLWELDSQQALHDISIEADPKHPPTQIVVGQESLVVLWSLGIHEWSLKERRWLPQRLNAEGKPLRASNIFPGGWASNYSRELFRYDASPQENERFKEAWYTNNYFKAGNFVDWVLEARRLPLVRRHAVRKLRQLGLVPHEPGHRPLRTFWSRRRLSLRPGRPRLRRAVAGGPALAYHHARAVRGARAAVSLYAATRPSGRLRRTIASISHVQPFSSSSRPTSSPMTHRAS